MEAQTALLRLLLSGFAAAFLAAACGQTQAENEQPFRAHSPKIVERSAGTHWRIEAGRSRAEGRYCQATAGIQGGTVSLTGFPESEGANLTISAPVFALRGTVDATVQFDDGIPLRFPGSLLDVESGLTIIVDNGRYFLNDVARASRLTVTAGDRTLTVPLQGRDEMVGGLSRCWNRPIAVVRRAGQN